MKKLGIIPARMGASRFPGKPLVDIGGKTMIQRVYEQVLKANVFDKVLIATDHETIFEEANSFGANVVMTSTAHRNGTERCVEALKLQEEVFDIVVNIQGDEPFIAPESIRDVLTAFENKEVQIATLVKKIEDSIDILNPTVVKVVFNHNKKALYFSRAAIPYHRMDGVAKHYKHIGLYAFRSNVIEELVKLPLNELERIEQLEQLRWLANDYPIHVVETTHESNSVDTPEDLIALKKQFNIT